MTRMASGVVEFDGGALVWESAGEGQDVVFLHPGLWDGRVWDEQFGVLSRTYRVLRFDFRGYGRSSRPEPGRPYSHVEDLAAVMDAAGVERAALIGNSMGGRVAVDFALTDAARVSALVLATPALSGFEGTQDEEAAWEAAFADVERQIEEAVRAGDLEGAQDLRLQHLWAPLGMDDEAGRRIREIAFDNLQELTMDESGEIPVDPPAAERLGEIDAPTLVLPADHDPPWHERMCEALAEDIRGARLVRIPETDHVIPLRRPEEFNQLVLGFLGQI
jgi:3-oxoadipate enol-lactonase